MVSLRGVEINSDQEFRGEWTTPWEFFPPLPWSLGVVFCAVLFAILVLEECSVLVWPLSKQVDCLPALTGDILLALMVYILT